MIFVADAFSDQLLGGAELTLQALIDTAPYKVHKLKCSDLTIDHLKDAVLALAGVFGGLTVASAEFATNDPETPITLAARVGEPVVLGAGDAQYEL